MIHELKTLPEYFILTAEGCKSFEVRKKDRPFQAGDYVALNEWENGRYTGRCMLCKIAIIFSDLSYCKEGYVILGLFPCSIGQTDEFSVYDRG